MIPYEQLIPVALYIIFIRFLGRELLNPLQTALLITVPLAIYKIAVGVILSQIPQHPPWQEVAILNIITTTILTPVLWSIFRTANKNPSDTALWLLMVMIGIGAILAIPAAITGLATRLPI